MIFKDFRELLYTTIALGLLDISAAVLIVIFLTEWQISALCKSNYLIIFIASFVVCGRYYFLCGMDSWDIDRAKREKEISALLGTAISFVSTTLPELAKMLCADAKDRTCAVLVAYLAIAVILLAVISYYRRVLEYIDEMEDKKTGNLTENHPKP